MEIVDNKDDVQFNEQQANELVAWVTDKCDIWRSHRDSNYKTQWDSYERLWRGIWSGEDKQRDSERSRVITPGLQQAIETHTAEVSEAVFGTGDYFFDIHDDIGDENKADVDEIKAGLHDRFKKSKVAKAVSDAILLGSLYGSGIGEIVVEEKPTQAPRTQAMPNTETLMVGVEESTEVCVYLKPVSPKNFLIDPNATSIEDALGVAVEEYVSAHKVAQSINDGIYRDVPIGLDSGDSELEPTQETAYSQDDRVKIIRYYGLVPRHLLEAVEGEDSEVVELFEKDPMAGEVKNEYGDLVEALVVIANDKALLKAEETPFMMKDRPFVAYQDDSVPNRFWGRGIAEKGFNMQMAMDAQVRAHMDSLALTTAPMMGIDATRMPRGFKFNVHPGKSILTNGNPQEILAPFKFGVTDPGNLQTAQAFQAMLLQATGTVDGAAMSSAPMQGESLSLALSGIIKKNKRTLINFQEQFLIPFIEKAAWRFMQFDPENFPAKDYKFVPTSTMGMLAREVEQQQFINLLKTFGPESPFTPVIMEGIIANSAFSNREQMLQTIKEKAQPDPQAQQAQQMQMQAQQVQMETSVQKVQAEVSKIQSEIFLNQARVAEIQTDIQLAPVVAQAKLTAAASNNLKDDSTTEFEKRIRIAELALHEKEIDTNVEITRMQMQKKKEDDTAFEEALNG